jgi:hypothetical protein
MMRDALHSSGKQVYDPIASAVLEKLLWPNDLDNLLAILECYPDHVVEFSAFDRTVGIIPGSSIIIWEVRLY